jgi:hypothetical protein
MINNLVEVKLSYKDVLKWKKDFDQLLLAFRSQDYRDIRSAIKGFQPIDKAFRTYFKNLKNYVQRDFFTLIDKQIKNFEASKTKPMRTQVALAFEALYDAYLTLSMDSNPMRYDPDGPHAASYKDIDQRIDWYVNSQWKDTTQYSKDIALEKAADKFFAKLREMIKYFSQDKKEFDADTYYPERVSFMGFSFVNNIYYDESDLKKMFSNMAPYLKIMKRFMPEVFYGPVFMEPRTPDQKDLKVGNMTIDAAGTYNSKGDKVTLYADDLQAWMTGATSVLIHELAHRYYFKFLDSSDRLRWEDFFNRLKTQGASEYGDQNPEEDFAEAILYYVLNKGVMKNKDVRDRVEALLKRTYREAREMRKPIEVGSFKFNHVKSTNNLIRLIELTNG